MHLSPLCLPRTTASLGQSPERRHYASCSVSTGRIWEKNCFSGPRDLSTIWPGCTSQWWPLLLETSGYQPAPRDEVSGFDFGCVILMMPRVERISTTFGEMTLHSLGPRRSKPSWEDVSTSPNRSYASMRLIRTRKQRQVSIAYWDAEYGLAQSA